MALRPKRDLGNMILGTEHGVPTTTCIPRRRVLVTPTPLRHEIPSHCHVATHI